MRKIFLLNVFVVLCAVAAHADMYDALQDAYDTNPVIAAARADVAVARGDLAAARTGIKPYLGLNANAGLARTRVFDNDYDTTPTEVGATFQQNVFQGFSTMAKIKGAKSMVDARTAQLYATEQDVFLSAINAYIDVLNADAVLKLNQNNQRVLQKYYDQCREKQRVGVYTKTDVAQASARLSAAKYQTIGASAEYDNALESFRRIYGRVPDAFTDISLTRVADLFPSGVAAADEYAMRHHPAILALESAEAAARQDITVARKTRRPSVDVRASAMQINDIPVVDKFRDGRVGLYLSVPLYDRGAASANVERVRQTVNGIVAQNQNTRRMVSEQLAQAWNTYQANLGAIDAAESAVNAAQLALSGTRDEQARGRRTVLDVLNAEQELLNAQVQLTRARHARTAAYFAVLAAMGKLTPENLGIDVDGAAEQE
ncbi:TolC family outer membrane protein [bacterium]|nr:TolC family outer membrane protein [bacterium]